MEAVSEISGFRKLKNNIAIGRPKLMEKSSIEFTGEGNICYFGEGVSLYNTSIKFKGNNSICFMMESHGRTKIKMDIYNNSVFYLGRKVNTVAPVHAILSEGKHVFIGDDCLFSRDIWLRNGDPHLIYDANTKQRTNVSRSIYLGDHVWVGQNVLLTKGTMIGSGSFIGGWSSSAGRRVRSNTAWGGSPIELIKEDVFWRKPSAHVYTGSETEKSMLFDSDEFIYSKDSGNLSFSDIDNELCGLKTAGERLEYLKLICENQDKNRFFIGE